MLFFRNKKIIKFFIVIAVLFVSAPAFFLGNDRAEASVNEVKITPEYRQTEARSMLPKLNSWRAGSTWYYNELNSKVYLNGLKALKYDYTLEQYAMQRAAEIAISFEHTRPEGKSTSGLVGYRGTGENIAATTNPAGGTADYALNMFKEDDKPYSLQGHRRIMLSVPADFTAVGMACVYYKGAYYWAQEFGVTGSPDTKATTAVNGNKTMTVKVETSRLESKSADLTELNNWSGKLNKGETDYLPKINLLLGLEETWPYETASVEAIPTWTSSKPSVASVNSGAGTVSGVAAGTSALSMKEPITNSSKTVSVQVSDPNSVTGVSLNKSTLSLNVGSSGTLTATVSPTTAANKNVTWSTSNSSVATVSSSGVVKAIKAGTATITATTVTGAKKASCKVVVSDIIPTSVSINKTSMRVSAGNTSTLTATVSPSNATNKSVKWSSSNTAVATVDENGVVKGIKAGSAVITATTVSGNKKATSEVTVYTVNATGLSLDSSSINVPYGKTKAISATVTPSDASDKTVIWSSSNPSVATVDANGNVKGVAAPGVAEITARTRDGNITRKCRVRVQFSDVTNTSSWYYDSVYWAADLGITTGSGGKFAPTNNCTREQAVVFLWRLMGKPEPKSLAVKFKDVRSKTSYSYKAIMWASENGIITGANGYFAPNGTCTREQIVTILWRLAGKPEPKSTVSKFSDVQNPKSYSYKAILWSIEQRITTRVGTFSPAGKCTRSEIVTFLSRYNSIFKVI